MGIVFVTGATGFIGTYVLNELHRQGCQAAVLVRNRKAYRPCHGEIVVEGNLSDCHTLQKALSGCPVESCIHLAWEGIPDYSYEMSRRNLQYGLNLLELCRDLNIKHLIVSGSCWEYKKPAGAVGEEWPPDDSDHFKAAKNALRMICHAFCKEHQIHMNWLRLFYVYGPGQRGGSLIPYIIEELSKSRFPRLKGACNQNDFIYVDDAAKALVRALLLAPEKEILNIGSGQATAVFDILRLVSEQMGVSVPQAIYPHAAPNLNFYANMQRTYSALCWKPEVTLDEGIKACVKMSVSRPADSEV